jgi:hypothetical protein
MRPEPRVLVGTLYAGENELDLCRESLRAQSHTCWEQRILQDLPNREAHLCLYRTFMEAAQEFDLFLKLDADMVLRQPDSLARLVEVFRDRPALDHLETDVQDWFSATPILGIHAFSNRVAWQEPADALFVDLPPGYPGCKLELRGQVAPLVDHCPDPSPEQAFSFGVHRALKTVQRDREADDFRPRRSLMQLGILCRTWEHFVRAGDRRLGLALWGAEQVFDGHIPFDTLVEKRDAVGPWFEAAARLDADALYRRLAPRWRHPRCRVARQAAAAALRWTGGRVARWLGPGPLRGLQP